MALIVNRPKDWLNVVDRYPRLSANANPERLSQHSCCRDDGKRVKVLKVIHDVVAVLIRCYCALRHISKKKQHMSFVTRNIEVG